MRSQFSIWHSLRWAILLALALVGSEAGAQSFDIAYLSEFRVHCTTGFGIGSMGVIINTGSQALDPSSLHVISVTADDPQVVPQMVIQQPPASSLGPGQADGLLSQAAEQLIAGSGQVPEPRASQQFYLSFGVSNMPQIEGHVIHATAELGLGNQTITLPFTVRWTADFPCTDFGILAVNRVRSSGGGGEIPAPRTAALTLTPVTKAGGTAGVIVEVAVIRFDGGHGSEYVLLTSSDPALPVPSTMTIPEGSDRNSIFVPTCVQSPTPVTVTATAQAGPVLSQTVQLLPSDFLVTDVALDQTSVVGGTTINATATLAAPAPPGAEITLTKEFSLFGSPVSVPSPISVPTGATSVSFQIKTSSVTATKTVKVEVAPACPPITLSLIVLPSPQPGNNSQTPPATGGTPPNGSSPPAQSKQFQLKFLEWVTETFPFGYRRVMRFQITNTGKATASGVTASAGGGFSQQEAPLTLEPGGTAVVRLAGSIQNSPDCGQSFKPYPITMSVTATNLPAEQTQMVISGPPDSPGCPQN